MPPARVTTRISLWLPPVAYMAVIFYFSSQSDALPDVTGRVWDKLLHVVVYAGLAATFCRALLGENLDWLTTVAAATLLASVYGATDEIHQLFVPLRNAAFGDWIADTLGASIGAAGWVGGCVRQKAGHDGWPSRP